MTCTLRILICLLFLCLVENTVFAAEKVEAKQNAVVEGTILEPPLTIDTVTQRLVALEEEVQRLKQESLLTPECQERLQQEMQRIEEELTKLYRHACTFAGDLDDKSFALSKRLTQAIRDRETRIQAAEEDVAVLRTATAHLRGLRDRADIEADDYREKVLSFRKSEWKVRMADTKLKLLRARQSCDILTVGFIENMIALEDLRRSIDDTEEEELSSPEVTGKRTE